jgi:cysteinyl-tRNA synthetase
MKDGVDPLAIRFALISGVYRKNLNFTDQGLVDAATNIDRFKRADETMKAGLESKRAGENTLGTELEKLYDEALEAMCSDLNTPVAIAKSLEGAKLISKEGDSITLSSAQSAEKFLNLVNDLLGIVRGSFHLQAFQENTSNVDSSRIEALIQERKEAKASKNWARADEIRKALTEEGITLTDNPDGTTSWAQA